MEQAYFDRTGLYNYIYIAIKSIMYGGPQPPNSGVFCVLGLRKMPGDVPFYGRIF